MTGYFRRVKVLALINCVTMHLLPYLNYIGAKLTLETTTTIQWSILVTADDLIDLSSERPKSNHLIGSQSPLLPSFPTTVRRLSYSPSSTGLAKEWALGCVNPASRLPLVAGGKFMEPKARSFAQPCRVIYLQDSPWYSGYIKIDCANNLYLP